MPEFQYIAKDAAGADRSGSLAAPSRSRAATQLREKGWLVLQVDPRAETIQSVAAGNLLTRNLPPRAVHVEVSLQQLAMMLRSGMTLLAALRAVGEQSSRHSLARTWNEVSAGIQRGQGLGEAMASHAMFPAFVVRLVDVGERTGNLSVVLKRAADTMRHRRTSRESFISATIYPALVVLLSILVAGYLVVYLIPRLESYLDSLGKDMPAMTQSLINASFWLREHYMLISAILIVAIFSLAGLYVSAEGRRWIDRGLLKIPGIGRLLRLGETSTFARGLGMMLKSGITVTDGLAAVENTLGNYQLRQNVTSAREKLIRGGSLVDALNEDGFTPLLRQMAAVGEKSGDLAGVLDEVAEMSDQQFASSVRRLNSIATPALTLAIGGIVGYVYIAFFMALVAAGS